MKHENDSTLNKTGNAENTNYVASIWSEEDFEELQEETPWELFASEINNWTNINFYSAEL